MVTIYCHGVRAKVVRERDYYLRLPDRQSRWQLVHVCSRCGARVRVAW